MKLERERGDDRGAVQELRCLSDTNKDIGAHGEGIQQAREALEIYGRLGDTVAQAGCLLDLAWLLHSDEQLDAAEEATSCATSLIPKEGSEPPVFQSHHILGKVYHSKGELEEATYHYETALGIKRWH